MKMGGKGGDMVGNKLKSKQNTDRHIAYVDPYDRQTDKNIQLPN